VNEKCLFKSSDIITFTYKYFLIIVSIWILLQAITYLPLEISITIAVLLMILLFNILFICSVRVYSEYVVIRQFRREQKFSYDQLKAIHQTRGVSPKVCFLLLKRRFFFKKLVLFFPSVELNDVFLAKTEDIVKFINTKIKDKKP